MARDRLRGLALAAVGRLAPRPGPQPDRPARLLLLRPDHLGDLLLTTPALAALRAALPDRHLALAVGPWSQPVALRGPTLDELLVCPFPGFSRSAPPHPLTPYRLLLRQARRLRGRYDLAVVLRPDHWWGALLARLAGLPALGYATPSTRHLLTEALPLPPGRHVAELSLTLARRAAELAAGQLAPFDNPPPPSFRLEPAERAWAAELAAAQAGPLVLLHPGSGSPLKNWPPVRWAPVADALAERGARIVLTGGPDDPDTPGAVAAALHTPPLQLAGQTGLGQLAALAERAVLALGADSGPLHLAAAVGTPTLRLYGPTDPHLFGPWPPGPRQRVLAVGLACQPCGNLLSPPCGARGEPPCLQAVEVETVRAAALDLFAQLTPERAE